MTWTIPSPAWARFIGRLAGILLVFGTLATPASGQVLPWPGEEIMDYQLSYLTGVIDQRDLRNSWVVFAGRDGMSTYHDAALSRPWKQLRFMQSFYVTEIDRDSGSVHLVVAEVGGLDEYRNARVTEDWGWARMDELLLSHRAFRDPKTFVPQRALVRTEMTAGGVAEVPKLYAAPSEGAEVVLELEYTAFSYVYKVWPAGEEGGYYDPLWGYQWYLISSEPFLNARPGSDMEVVGRRGYIGWLKGGHTLIWNTREALEPVPGRSRTASVFMEDNMALEYAHDPSVLDQAVLRDTTPTERTWKGQRFRYPVLGQSAAQRGNARARLIAHQGRVRFEGQTDDDRDLGVDYSDLETMLHRLRAALENPKVIFVFDGTMSMCDHIASTVAAAGEIVRDVKSRGIEVEVGAVVYKDKADRSEETQVFSPTPDLDELLRQLKGVNCRQAPDDDYEESVLKGLYDAWDKALGRQEDSYVTYILMGDAGSSTKESLSIDKVARQLSGLGANGEGMWNLFSLHAFYVVHPAQNPAEQAAMDKFHLHIREQLLKTFQQVEHRLLETSFSPHSFQNLDVGNLGARQAAAQKAAAAIEETKRRIESMKDKVEHMLATGAPLEDSGQSGSPPPGSAVPPPSGETSVDDPVATTMMKLYLKSRLGEAGLKQALEQRSQIFYTGWVATHDAAGEEIMSPVLFLTPHETSVLLDMATRVREYRDCEEVKKYFRGLIGATSPEDEQLPIAVLIEKRHGIRFQSPLLQVPYDAIDTLCSTSNAKKFSDLIKSFNDLDQFLFTLTTSDSADPEESRKYELLSGDFFWVPVGKLP